MYLASQSLVADPFQWFQPGPACMPLVLTALAATLVLNLVDHDVLVAHHNLTGL